MFRSAVLGSALLLAAAAAPSQAQEVIELASQEELDTAVETHQQVLVEFFAPWCGHCKALAPEFASAATDLEGKEAGALASVDCTEHRELCSTYGVRGFPTLKLFRASGAEPSDYDQARKSDAIVKFMVKQSQPAVTELEADAVAGFAADEAVKVVAYVKEGTDVAAYTAVAESLRNDYSFGVVKGADEDKVVVHRNFDEGDVTFEGEFGAESFGDDLTSYIKAQSFPVVGEIGPENYSKYLERGFPFAWLFVDYDAEETPALLEAVAEVAKDFRDKLSFVKLDGVKWAEHGKSFGLSGGVPGIAIEDRDRRKNYLFKEGEAVTVESFRTFVQGYADGSLAPNVKSEPIPEPNDEPVTVLVGKNFEDIVMDTGKDVLVEFYAPWCGHCKSLAPKYDELGEQYKGDDNVVIAKIDATANDHPADVQGFPTLIFYSAEDNTQVEYSGARTAEAMAAFIEENRKSSAGAAAATEEKEEEKKTEGHEEL